MKVNEMTGGGNHYDFKYRGYDPRTGRFASVDPLAQKYPWNSSYAFAENKVIDGIDLEGGEHIYYMLSLNEKTGATSIQHLKSEYGHFDRMINKWEPYPAGVFVSYKGQEYRFFEGGYAPYLPQNSIEGFESWINSSAKNRPDFASTFGSEEDWRKG